MTGINAGINVPSRANRCEVKDWFEPNPAKQQPEKAGSVYDVKKGDCIWNIAKNHLNQKLGRKATNAEILKLTNEIAKANGIEIKKNGFALIKPGDKLTISG